jgi:hypothetical protein
MRLRNRAKRRHADHFSALGAWGALAAWSLQSGARNGPTVTRYEAYLSSLLSIFARDRARSLARTPSATATTVFVGGG